MSKVQPELCNICLEQYNKKIAIDDIKYLTGNKIACIKCNYSTCTHCTKKYLLSSNNDAHVICASGLSEVTVPMAISVGATGVGIGSAVNKLNTELAMIATVKGLRQSLNSCQLVSTINR